jgi:hypothetical protein
MPQSLSSLLLTHLLAGRGEGAMHLFLGRSLLVERCKSSGWKSASLPLCASRTPSGKGPRPTTNDQGGLYTNNGATSMARHTPFTTRDARCDGAARFRLLDGLYGLRDHENIASGGAYQTLPEPFLTQMRLTGAEISI